MSAPFPSFCMFNCFLSLLAVSTIAYHSLSTLRAAVITEKMIDPEQIRTCSKPRSHAEHDPTSALKIRRSQPVVSTCVVTDVCVVLTNSFAFG